MARTLVAGIGNIFLGDDGFGVEVARRLQSRQLPDGVDVVDFGVRGVHLAYELAGGRYDAAVFVDAVPRGGVPGTLYVIEAEAMTAAADAEPADAHSLTPHAVLAWLRRIGGCSCERIMIVGCEPASLDESMELSAPVAAAVDGALRLVLELLTGAGDKAERIPLSCA